MYHRTLTYFLHLARQAGLTLDMDNADLGMGRFVEIPHPTLGRALLEDPSIAALLPISPCRFAPGFLDVEPFRIVDDDLVLLSDKLLIDAPALAMAARWGIECLRYRIHGAISSSGWIGLARHGRALFARLPETSARSLCACLPDDVAHALRSAPIQEGKPCEIADWLLACLSQADLAGVDETAPVIVPELMGTVEDLLIAGGDSRLVLDAISGQNRYGVPPHPKPFAIHFSSSTASPISEHGFMLCELFRRILQFQPSSGHAPWHALLRTVAREIIGLLGLSEREADIAISPSGTDAELLAVMVARAASPGGRIVNIITASAEVGRGTVLAGEGRYFDDVAPSGDSIEKGTLVWRDDQVVAVDVPIRSADSALMSTEEIDRLFIGACDRAIRDGNRVIAHAVLCSKTGAEAPSPEILEEVLDRWPEQLDVVVDACQMRVNFQQLGELCKRGCMVQVSGSKFLTGPPFSGALVVPSIFRDRDIELEQRLRLTPTLGGVGAWLKRWPSGEVREAATFGYGPIFRWLPAVLEARLFEMVPDALRYSAYEQFRSRLLYFIGTNEAVRLIESERAEQGSAGHAPANYIFSFEVLARQADGSRHILGASDCQTFFSLLNTDCSSLVAASSARDVGLARQLVHIGQPVILGRGPTSIAVLRFVLGARFFNAVGHAKPSVRRAVIESEISDAQRAFAKIELLAGQWWQIRERMTG